MLVLFPPSAGYNSLPRPRPNTGGPASLSHARRKIVNSALQDYLKSLNSMTRSIVLETETVEKEHKYNWTTLDEARKEDLVNDHFMPADVRLHYDSERAASCCDIRQSPERAGGNQDLPTHQEDLMSSRDLVYRNDWSSTVSSKLQIVCQYSPSIILVRCIFVAVSIVHAMELTLEIEPCVSML